MPVTVVVGGQFGSEGKGKVAHELARTSNTKFAIRVGGSNSGHTVIDPNGKAQAFRHLPTASILPNVTSVIGPGSYIDPDVLVEEIATVGLTPDTLLIDPNAVLITPEHRAAEAVSGLVPAIGSTGSGTGAAVISRIERKPDLKFAGADHRLEPFIVGTRPILREALNRYERVLIEGTQGFGLSLLNSGNYPKVTSRDTTAAAFVAEAGLSPLDVDDVVMVVRAHPIRVAGHSGLLPNETDWETVTAASGSKTPLVEYTTVTKKERRIGNFDERVVISAIEANTPTRIVMNHLDYIDANCRQTNSASRRVRRFVHDCERRISRKFDFLGFGPSSLVTYSYFLDKHRSA